MHKFDDEINSMIDEFTGSDFKTESFVSDKNEDLEFSTVCNKNTRKKQKKL